MGSRYPQGSESDPFFDLLPSSNTAYSEVPPETRKNVDSSLGDIEYASGGPSYDFQPGRGLSKRNAGSNGGGSNSARKDDELPVRLFVSPSILPYHTVDPWIARVFGGEVWLVACFRACKPNFTSYAPDSTVERF